MSCCLQTDLGKGYIELSAPLTFAQPYSFLALREKAMVGCRHCNITMICTCCDLNITPDPLFGALTTFSHVALTAAA